jgi:hypothetical protein
MTVPGSNLLTRAARLIRLQSVSYRQYLSRSTNAAGFDVSTYAAPVAIKGSVQPVPRSMYERLGLDFQKNYVTLYTVTGVLDIARGAGSDQIDWNGRRFQIESETDWHAIDGWTGALCVDVGAAS